MKILLATTNPGKLREIQAVAAMTTVPARAGAPSLEIIGLSDLPVTVEEPVEDGLTFEANAVLKASHYADATGLPCIADDSGLEVDALDGAPGVHSARYAGVDGSREVCDPANNRKLLEVLGDLPAHERSARFVCAMALMLPDQAEPAAVVRGEFEGRILGPGDVGFVDEDPGAGFRGRGENGFGYDPLFLLPAMGKTSAQLTPAQKNSISHRGRATRKMLKAVESIFFAAADKTQ